ncbi:hypothetical protein BG74_04860 [Sodalis-like endosymbiont of Proechinophthirus fluctus]|uniref:enoyl-CoA hydratase/isomerase family protein n=1 Tax=Sodalis-like endosymbiont of Proechinophthirus fluctus TaxID=1462730 RepID=UPI0007A81006|nr:enoyl-CoA hydratase/isomerase family protein [Sodalis-like endosymbiont of Proechinophthirus fluctus]KYP97197.1 hypothetical protein BG74_04860 [Sodalis-like endosymbiont of Proechinophthirus fluctus]
MGPLLKVINRPKKINAMKPEMSKALALLFTLLNNEDAVHIILLRGEGERTFIAGRDLRTLSRYHFIHPWIFVIVPITALL